MYPIEFVHELCVVFAFFLVDFSWKNDSFRYR